MQRAAAARSRPRSRPRPLCAHREPSRPDRHSVPQPAPLVPVPVLGAEDKRARFATAAERLQAHPAVRGVTWSQSVPFYTSWATGARVAGRDSLPVPTSGGPYINGVTASGIVEDARKGRTAVPGVGWQAYLVDPEGNPFAIFQLDPSAR